MKAKKKTVKKMGMGGKKKSYGKGGKKKYGMGGPGPKSYGAVRKLKKNTRKKKK